MTDRRVARVARHGMALLATLIGFALAAPPSHAACEKDAGGIGGTGNAPGSKTPPSGKGKDRGGIGGTGRSERDAGGIGGTGRRERDEGGVGGTGIVGVITGFGSVCVNGLEVEYDAATPVDANGAPSSTSALAVGQVVVIEASERAGTLHADRIGVRSVAVGPVERVDVRRGEMDVLGQHVRIDPATRVVDAAGRPAAAGDIAPGSFVAVSGLRDAAGSVTATRIEPIAPRDTVSVMGPLTASRAGAVAIGGMAIEPARGDTARTDRVALVIGRLDPRSGALHADRIEPAVQFTRRPERVFVEGLVQDGTAKGFRLDHAYVDATAIGAASARPAPGSRVVIGGAYAPDGSVRAERIDVVAPEPPSQPDPKHDRDEDRDRGARGDRDERHENESREHGEHEAGEKPEKVEKPEKAEKPETHESPEQPEHHEAPEQPEHHETPDRPETPDAPEVERPESPEHVEKPEAPEVPETPERVERPEVHEVERPETPELPEVERPETPELPEIERPEAPERIEVERPETPERIEVERPETPERVERPETPEVHEVERPESPERPDHDD